MGSKMIYEGGPVVSSEPDIPPQDEPEFSPEREAEMVKLDELETAIEEDGF